MSLSFTAGAADMANTLKRLLPTVPRNSNIPILSYVLIRHLRDNQIALTATDVDIHHQEVIEVRKIKPSDESFAVPAHDLVKAIKEMNESEDSECSFVFSKSEDRDILTIKNSDGTFDVEFDCAYASDFPEAPSVSGHRLTIPVGDLVSTLNRVRHAISNEETRYYLNGVLFDLSRRRVRLVATDGHRLAVNNLKAESPALSEERTNPIVPKNVVAALTRLFDEDDERDAGIYFDEKPLARLHVGMTTLTFKLIDGTFPDYERVYDKKLITGDANSTIVANAADILKAISRSACVAKGTNKQVTISANGSVTLSSRYEGRSKARLEADVSGRPVEIGFNANYLADAIKSLGEDKTIWLKITSPIEPAILTAGRPDAFEVLTPLRN